jgi:imidazolonepropionase-like amidohydrolase
MRKIIFCFLVFLSAATLEAQETFPKAGIRDKTPRVHAFVGGTIVVAPGKTISDGTLVIRDGRIEGVGKKMALPGDAVIHDVSGLRIYPGFIESYCPIPSADLRTVRRAGGPVHWNPAVHPETDAAELLTIDSLRAASLRSQGFTCAHMFSGDGIFRGTGVLVGLGCGSVQEEVIETRVSTNLSFEKGHSKEAYPSSLMGAIALMRQTVLDAQWYRAITDTRSARTGSWMPEYNRSLEALGDQLSRCLPFFFEARSTLDILRVVAIAREFGLRIVVKSSGSEYERLEAVADAGVSLIVPVNFPAPYRIQDPDETLEIPLRDMKHWEWAPSNPASLSRAGVVFALTTAGLDCTEAFLKNVRRAVLRGLAEDQALEALTLVPARMLGVEALMGSLEKGKLANFVVASGDLFSSDAVVLESWIAGRPNMVVDRPAVDLRGVYRLNMLDRTFGLVIAGTRERFVAAVRVGTFETPAEVYARDGVVVLAFGSDSLDAKGKLWLKGHYESGRLSGTVEGDLTGRPTWTALRVTDLPTDSSTAGRALDAVMSEITYPNGPYGWTVEPPQLSVLFRNATVWTNTARGILRNADVLIEKGKVRLVGAGLEAPAGAVVVDAAGKHLTTGIVDEHSHTAIEGGVNEWAQAVSAEVRIGDVIDADDVNIYRQLAGGVTTAQLLHGSANPIGGQSSIIKFRWGRLPEEMKVEGAPGFIKFALGENVKQSNWGDAYTTRYPQTRLGVEQIIKDEFQTAKEHTKQWEKYEAAGGKKSRLPPPRRDLELDAIAEILDGKRFITCHSYVQSEITMLIRLAEQMGFRVNTFTHILEGYKVADKLKQHGAGASSFSDWWAYKYEVYDAIPYNGALLSRQGVVTGFNSDSDEMARRLNQEAAKGVKYGNLAEEEAWKLVTLNPAVMLHLDHRIGRIEPGMDADLVLWSDHPMSVYARALQTFVDGRCYFDAKRDTELKEKIDAERRRIIRKMAEAIDEGERPREYRRKAKTPYRCD